MPPDEPIPLRRPRGPLPGGSPRTRALLITVAILGALVVAFSVFAGFYTDLLWFRSVGFSGVFTTRLFTRIALFVLFGLLMGLAVWANMWIAHRSRPAFRGLSPEQQNLDRYRVAIDPYRRGLSIALAGVVGLLAGGSAAAEWRGWLLFRNSKPFGVKDAQFGTDLSFFVFRLPFWRFLVGFGFAVVVLSLIVALLTHYLYGGLRPQTPGETTTAAARTHIAILLGVFVLLKAVAYWLDRYGLVIKDSGRISGATYTDVNAVLPFQCPALARGAPAARRTARARPRRYPLGTWRNPRRRRSARGRSSPPGSTRRSARSSCRGAWGCSRRRSSSCR